MRWINSLSVSVILILLVYDFVSFLFLFSLRFVLHFAIPCTLVIHFVWHGSNNCNHACLLTWIHNSSSNIPKCAKLIEICQFHTMQKSITMAPNWHFSATVVLQTILSKRSSKNYFFFSLRFNRLSIAYTPSIIGYNTYTDWTT